MYNDTKTAADRLNRNNGLKPRALAILSLIVFTLFILGGAHDFAMIQAGLI